MNAELLHQLVCDAVRTHQLLRLNFHHYSRVVEPYALGSDQADKPVLVAWQLTGGCDSGVVVGWKQFLLEEITGLIELSELFEPVRNRDARAFWRSKNRRPAPSPDNASGQRHPQCAPIR